MSRCSARWRRRPAQPDAETLRDAVSSTVSGILGLVGIDADPIKSREHILLSTILASAWQQGQSLDLPGLIAQIQSPPFTTVGVIDVETFYKASDRFALAMQINNLLAAPGFDLWLKGEPLDMQRMLVTPEGQAARVDLLDRAPVRRRADVLRDAAVERDGGVDARAERARRRCARSTTWTRSSGSSRRSPSRPRSGRC